MFGLGFMEIFVILVVAIIALGPEKLPSVAVDIAKFLKKMKSGIEDAKSTLDSELNLTQMKEEANSLKSHVNLDRLANLDINEPTKTEAIIEQHKAKTAQNETPQETPKEGTKA